jgi:hypothetical protein
MVLDVLPGERGVLDVAAGEDAVLDLTGLRMITLLAVILVPPSAMNTAAVATTLA